MLDEDEDNNGGVDPYVDPIIQEDEYHRNERVIMSSHSRAA